MHEIGIANSILAAGRKEADLRPGAKLVGVGVRVGVLAGVDTEALRFAFQCIVAGTDDADVVFTTERCPRINRCEACGCEFPSPDVAPLLDAACPQCGSTHTSFVSGDQLDLAYVEVEEP